MMQTILSAIEQSAVIQYYLMVALCLWPCWHALGRMGLPRFGAALLFVPLLGFALVMGFAAFKKWPVLPPRPPRVKREKKA